MARIAFDKATREALARRLVRRLSDDLGVEIEPMDGQRLLDLLSEEVGAHFYNQGLYDAQAVLRAKAEAIAEDIEGLAQPTLR